ncbi:MAG TPA: tRNA preQ1(34) S-adenosylmethionine ribosyltransferase-isomerase QueA [Myxococcaceae bacterium]
MKVSDFEFELPPELIAQRPAERRDASRLLVLRQSGNGAIEHRTFAELPELLAPGDLLVLNDARVVPARLLGHKAGTGGKVELLLVRPSAQDDATAADALGREVGALRWVCLGQASKGLKPGAVVELEADLKAEVLESRGGGELLVRFSGPQRSLLEAIDRAGRLPLPPYIERPPTAEDADRYQTVYARSPGSVAAPTAGLHFTPEILDRLSARGIGRADVTLDVGPGTFLPVRTEDVEGHAMHPERFHVPDATAAAVNAAPRVVAAGTTVVRTLESATDLETGTLRSGAGETRLFITPGFTFRQVDVLLTNFHLPRSTLLMLVSALAGRERTLAAYREAVERRYRFFSYGDAMLVLP